MSGRSYNLQARNTFLTFTTRFCDIFPSRRGYMRFYITPMPHFIVLRRRIIPDNPLCLQNYIKYVNYTISARKIYVYKLFAV